MRDSLLYLSMCPCGVRNLAHCGISLVIKLVGKSNLSIPQNTSEKALNFVQSSSIGGGSMGKILEKVRGMQEMAIDRPGKIEDCSNEIGLRS